MSQHTPVPPIAHEPTHVVYVYFIENALSIIWVKPRLVRSAPRELSSLLWDILVSMKVCHAFVMGNLLNVQLRSHLILKHTEPEIQFVEGLFFSWDYHKNSPSWLS